MGVPQPVISKIVQEGKDFLQGFSDGDIYHTYANAFNPEEILYVVLEKDPVNYVVVELNDDLEIYEGQRELTIKRKVYDGIIKLLFSIHSEVISFSRN
jgi:hypothetical protein